MPNLNENDKYECSVCGKEYQNPLMVQYCEKTHDVIYIEIKKSDLFRLMQFIQMGDYSLLDTPGLRKFINTYNRGEYS